MSVYKEQMVKDEVINLTEIEVYNQLGQKITTGITPSWISRRIWPTISNRWEKWDRCKRSSSPSKDAYIQLDLGADVMVSKIIIKNRLNCCKERIIGTSLILQNNSITEIYRKVIPKTLVIEKQQD